MQTQPEHQTTSGNHPSVLGEAEPAPSSAEIQEALTDLDVPLRISIPFFLLAAGTAGLAIIIIYFAVAQHLSIAEIVAIYGAVFGLFAIMGAFAWTRMQRANHRLQSNARRLENIEKQLQRAAAETRSLQRLLVDAVDSIEEGFVLFDDQNILVVCNDCYRKAYPNIADLLVPGASFSAILATAAQRLGVAGDSSPSDLKQWVDDRLRRHLTSVTPQECQLTDGHWYRISERPTRAGGIVKILSDVTTTKEHEQELANKSAVLESTFDAMAQGVAVFDGEARLLTWNDHLAPVTGYPSYLLQVGTPLQSFRDFDEQRRAVAVPLLQSMGPLPASLAGVLPSAETAQDHLAELELPGGEHIEIRSSSMSRGGMVVTFSDITARRQTESALQHAQKMDAIGQLAGGIAHEFNNMLTSIGGFARMALRSPDDSERVVMCLEEVTKAADRAASLTSQLLNFSRRSLSEEQRPIRLKDLLRDLSNFLRPLLGERVDVSVNIENPDLIVSGDQAKLHQAVVNLCINARDAMPAGGEIFLSLSTLKNADNPDLFERHPSLDRSRTYAALRVQDYGTGIAPELLPRIFEPFFTTKEQGKGTGLGLPMVYSVAEHMGGAIDVASELEHGSTFTLVLPLSEPENPNATLPMGEHADFDGEDLTILLAEDEDAVRRFITMTLEEANCTVLTAANGDEAAKIFSQDQDAIDILISDVVMPGMDGPTLARTLLETNPDLKIILMSGYSATDDWKTLAEGPGRMFLKKPVAPESLLAAVQAVMKSVE